MSDKCVFYQTIIQLNHPATIRRLPLRRRLWERLPECGLIGMMNLIHPSETEAPKKKRKKTQG